MSDFEQRKLDVEPPPPEGEETYEQTELFPGSRQTRFWPSAKYIRIGRVGLFHARLALKKAKNQLVEPKEV